MHYKKTLKNTILDFVVEQNTVGCNIDSFLPLLVDQNFAVLLVLCFILIKTHSRHHIDRRLNYYISGLGNWADQ